MKLEEYLYRWFGYSEFRPSKGVITDLLEGKDVIAMLPTGRGKSMCYQLRAYARRDSTCCITIIIFDGRSGYTIKICCENRVIAFNSFRTLQEKEKR